VSLLPLRENAFDDTNRSTLRGLADALFPPNAPEHNTADQYELVARMPAKGFFICAWCPVGNPDAVNYSLVFVRGPSLDYPGALATYVWGIAGLMASPARLRSTFPLAEVYSLTGLAVLELPGRAAEKRAPQAGRPKRNDEPQQPRDEDVAFYRAAAAETLDPPPRGKAPTPTPPTASQAETVAAIRAHQKALVDDQLPPAEVFSGIPREKPVEPFLRELQKSSAP
jgi:hypothetical protein